MDQRDFLRRTSLALAGGLVVGPQVMEMYEQASLRDDLLDYMARVNHKKVFALGAMPNKREPGDVRWATTWYEITWPNGMTTKHDYPFALTNDYIILANRA